MWWASSRKTIYGSSVGDAVLRTVATIVKERLRTSDLLARMQGEQFIVIATHTNAADAMRLAEKLRKAIMEADLPGEATVVISLSVSQTRSDDGVSAVLERLDVALQRAKRVGRCCIELAD
jgi:diguanylate cyclase (GGDEF)-like protein